MEMVYRTDGRGNTIRGYGLPAFIHNRVFFFDLIKVFEDGMIDCWGLVDFNEFKQKVKEGWIVTEVPEGAEIDFHHLCYGKSTLKFYVKIEEFVKEVEDVLRELRGESTSSLGCLNKFYNYIDSPTERNRADLQLSYKAVPEHLRHYLIDQDFKDGPIRAIVENEEIDPETFKFWRSLWGKQKPKRPQKVYKSEQSEILDRFGFNKMLNIMQITTHLSKELGKTLPQADLGNQFSKEQRALTEYTQKMNEWLKHNKLTQGMTVRYMLVGLHTQLSGMRKFRGMSFSEVLEQYCQTPDVARKFDLFEKYYGKRLENFKEYEDLFTLTSFDQLTGDALFRFVVEGKTIP